MLEVKDATISVSGRILIKNLSLIAPDGEVTCITGSEGSGKTTFLHTLMGFIPVSEGFVSVDGELLTVNSAPAFRRFMCYLPQNIDMLRYQLYPMETKPVKPDEYGVWNEVLPSPEEIPENKPLSPEEIFNLASKTITEASDRLSMFNKVCGTDFVSSKFGQTMKVSDIADFWSADVPAFKALSKKYYIY